MIHLLFYSPFHSLSRLFCFFFLEIFIVTRLNPTRSRSSYGTCLFVCSSFLSYTLLYLFRIAHFNRTHTLVHIYIYINKIYLHEYSTHEDFDARRSLVSRFTRQTQSRSLLMSVPGDPWCKLNPRTRRRCLAQAEKVARNFHVAGCCWLSCSLLTDAIAQIVLYRIGQLTPAIADTRKLVACNHILQFAQSWTLKICILPETAYIQSNVNYELRWPCASHPRTSAMAPRDSFRHTMKSSRGIFFSLDKEANNDMYKGIGRSITTVQRRL